MSSDTNALALLFVMDLVATAAKVGDPLATPFLEAEAVIIMPGGVAIYRQAEFNRVLEKLMTERV